MEVVEDRLIKREWFKGEYRMLATTLANGNTPPPAVKKKSRPVS
jgi:hypothetical protein